MFTFLYALVGIFVGMVINRAADNLPPPARRSLWVTPRCPYCDTPRSILEQSGIVSFVLRRDKCHNCAAPLSLRAPLVEICAAMLFAFLANRYPLGIYLALVSFFAAALLLVAVIDIEHKLILNVVTLPTTLLAILASPILLDGLWFTIGGVTLSSFGLSLAGAVTGYLLTLGIYYLGVLFLIVVNRGRRQKINTVAFGMGDVKLMGLLGALVGVPAIFYVLVCAALLGGVGAALVILFRLVTRRGYSAFMAISYGPYLILAGGAFLIFGPELFAFLFAR
ncbi:MAG: prepilin peptidase [Chloroflexi bacterium]|nr:prepilin peptidase [Chloroflexota bacterium]